MQGTWDRGSIPPGLHRCQRRQQALSGGDGPVSIPKPPGKYAWSTHVRSAWQVLRQGMPYTRGGQRGPVRRCSSSTWHSTPAHTGEPGAPPGGKQPSGNIPGRQMGKGCARSANARTCFTSSPEKPATSSPSRACQVSAGSSFPESSRICRQVQCTSTHGSAQGKAADWPDLVDDGQQLPRMAQLEGKPASLPVIFIHQSILQLLCLQRVQLSERDDNTPSTTRPAGIKVPEFSSRPHLNLLLLLRIVERCTVPPYIDDCIAAARRHQAIATRGCCQGPDLPRVCHLAQ